MNILISLSQFFKKLSRYTYIYLAFFLFIFSAPSHGVEVNAEIININPVQKIFFVDGGRDVFSVGDVVMVNGVAEPIYLEVLEVSDGISQLGASSNASFNSSVDSLVNISIGMNVTRVYLNPSTHNHSHATINSSTPLNQEQVIVNNLQQLPSTVEVIVPTISVQPVDKTDITKESIQSLGMKMDKMAENNARLVSALAQCQAGQADVQKINTTNVLLKKQIDESSIKFDSITADRDKYKRIADERNAKIIELKERLNHLNKTIQEQLK